MPPSPDAIVRGIWSRDPETWGAPPRSETAALIANGLGWLDVVAEMHAQAPDLQRFAERALDGVDFVFLCTAPGAMPAIAAFQEAFPTLAGRPEVVLVSAGDQTDIDRGLAQVDPSKTLFVFTSKLGTADRVLPPFDPLWALCPRGDRWLALTDAGTDLARLADDRGFRRAFLPRPDIAGQYCALSLYGLVPAALLGVDLLRLLERATEMANRCGPEAPPDGNPGARLGLDIAGQRIAPAPSPNALSAWAARLMFESGLEDCPSPAINLANPYDLGA
ncbi:MAG: hypothetical protein JOZ39_04635, partial [Chloroflexi bacterium]|nr:hypothetical protein [Chloroflexota bacterium]